MLNKQSFVKHETSPHIIHDEIYDQNCRSNILHRPTLVTYYLHYVRRNEEKFCITGRRPRGLLDVSSQNVSYHFAKHL